MKKYAIIMCGGCGKTTMFKKYPYLFLDIDDFIWDYDNKKYREKLLKYCENGDIDNISKLYKNVMTENDILRNDDRIILAHHPDNAKDLDRICLDIIRPNKELHLKNIQNRNKILQKFSINDYNSLTKYNPYEYNSFDDLEIRLLGCLNIKNQNPSSN